MRINVLAHVSATSVYEYGIGAIYHKWVSFIYICSALLLSDFALA